MTDQRALRPFRKATPVKNSFLPGQNVISTNPVSSDDASRLSNTDSALNTQQNNPSNFLARSRIWSISLEISGLLFCLGIFLILTVSQLSLPGLYNDESLDLVPAMEFVKGLPVELNRNVGISFGNGHSLPLMTSDYQGAISTYLAVPVFAIWGAEGYRIVYEIRGLTLLWGIIALILTWLLGRRLFGRWGGLIATLLLAILPSYIYWSRLGIYVVSEVVPISLGAYLGLSRWRKTGNLPWLALALFLLGLGLSTKLLYIWVYGGLLGTGIVLSLRELWQARTSLPWLRLWRKNNRPGGLQLPGLPALSWSGLSVALSSFLLGAAPFLLYNILTQGTLLVMRSNLTTPTPNKVDNKALIANLYEELKATKILLDGSYFWFLTSGNTPSNSLYLLFIGIAAVICAVGLLLTMKAPRRWRIVSLLLFILTVVLSLVWTNAEESPRKVNLANLSGFSVTITLITLFILWGWFAPPARLASALERKLYRATLFCWGMPLIMLLESIFTVSGLWPTHLLILLPFPQFGLIAAGLWGWRIWHRLLLVLSRQRSPARLLVQGSRMTYLIMLTLLLLTFSRSDLNVDAAYAAAMQESRGRFSFSDAIYTLVSDLSDLQAKKIIAMDWGYRSNVQLLSGGRFNPQQIYGDKIEADENIRQTLRHAVKDDQVYFVFPSDCVARNNHWNDFVTAVQEAQRTVHTRRAITQHDGLDLYYIYTTRDANQKNDALKSPPRFQPPGTCK